MALATQADVEDALGRSLTAAEEAKVDAKLDRASAAVVGFTGQEFVLVEDDNVILYLDGYCITLPQRPVVEISSVKVIGINGLPASPVVGYRFDGIDEISLQGINYVINYPEAWVSYPWDTFEVVYTHGYASVPTDVVTVVAGRVAESLTSPTSSSGVSGVESETSGIYSYRLAKGAGPFSESFLSDGDKAILAKYGRQDSARSVRLV